MTSPKPEMVWVVVKLTREEVRALTFDKPLPKTAQPFNDGHDKMVAALRSALHETERASKGWRRMNLSEGRLGQRVVIGGIQPPRTGRWKSVIVVPIEGETP